MFSTRCAPAPSEGRPAAARRAIAGLAVTAVLGGLVIPTVLAGSAAADSVSDAAAAGLSTVTQDVSALNAFDADVLRLFNSARAKAGVAPLQEARGLDALAGWWSTQLASGSGALTHNPAGLKMAKEYGASGRKVWAENVAKLSRASGVTAQDLVDSYLASPTHKANILNPKFGFVGVGSVTTAAGVSFNTVNFTDAADAGQTFDPKAAASPIGRFASLTVAGATVRVTGWGLDPEIATAPSTVRFTDTAADGTVVTKTTSAALARTDLATAYPRSGAAHGFDQSYVTGTRGAHIVCATVVDTGIGLGDTELGCLGYTVGAPVGSFETATVADRTLTVSGWAVDPDRPAAATTVTVTDRIGQGPVTTSTVVADLPAPGADASVPGAGTAHGFSARAAIAGAGIHTVCASVTGVRSAAVVTDLGCRTVAVAAAAPVGVFDTVGTPDRRSVSVAGWAADPDAPTAPSSVSVTIRNSAGTTTTTLNAAVDLPTDLGGGMGRAHAFSATLPLTAEGVNTVCVTAMSRSSATATTALGCKDVTVSWLHGWLDKAVPTTAGSNRTIALTGWAIDQGAPTTPARIALKVTAPDAAKSFVTTITADTERADVGRAFAGTGDNHGYLATLKVPSAGKYQVCAVEISPRNAALTKELRCLDVTVA